MQSTEKERDNEHIMSKGIVCQMVIKATKWNQGKRDQEIRILGEIQFYIYWNIDILVSDVWQWFDICIYC